MNNRVTSKGSKLGNSQGADASRRRGRAAIGLTAGTVAGLMLGGCATAPAPEPVSERLDPDTATTVTILNRPIELVSQSTTRHIGDSDPFAYVAPFETNRMGARDLYLWVSTPQAGGSLVPPQVLCNGQPLSLQPLSKDPTRPTGDDPSAGAHFAPGNNVSPDPSSGEPVKVDLSKLSLSRAPYDAPVPWGTQWYFRLPPESLKCLADADGIAIQAKSQDGGPDHYETVERKELASLDAFTRR